MSKWLDIKTPEEIIQDAAWAKESDECYAAHDQIEAALELIADLTPKWVSVDERLPEDEQDVFVYGIENGSPFWDATYYRQHSGEPPYWGCTGFDHESEVTHWMPLPPPPEGEE